MASGDGLIVRLGRSASVLSPQTALALADLAERCGNGLLDLSSRGNLQFRGVTDESLPLLQAQLDKLGLMEQENGCAAARTIMMSPLAGIDPAALIDSRSIVAALQARLLATPAMDQLPPKFCFAVDDGGLLSITGEKADVSFVPRHCDEGALQLVISLGGTRAGMCVPGELSDVATRLGQVFLDLHGTGANGAQRMDDLVRRLGALAILRAAGVAALATDVAPPKLPKPIGRFRIGELHALGVGLPFGRLDGMTVALLAAVAERSRGELRLTPWRAVLLIGEHEPESEAIKDAGLILDADDPLRAVAACPGAPGCAHGTTATQADARRLAPFARQAQAQGVAVHVSGCAKGCAHPAPASVTFVGRDGTYDMVIDGRADHTPIKEGVRADKLAAALRDLKNGAAQASI
jgi:precorrin-3B synthase